MLECVALSKRFGATQALLDVDLTVAAGEVVALVGENGAGKSTLVNIVSGALAPDGGEVRIGGHPVAEFTPREATDLGVAVIHQELSYVPMMTVAENLLLSHLPHRSRLMLDWGGLFGRAAEILEPIAPHVDVRRPMQQLRVGDRQLVEVARALSGGAGVVLMDEPTASLNSVETERLFAVIRRLQGDGIGVLYISHRLDELERVADGVVVLRDGRRVSMHRMTEVTRERLVADIVGETLAGIEVGTRRPTPDAEVGLSVHQVGAPPELEPMSFEVRNGQVLGLYGLAGSGVERIAYALVGAVQCTGKLRVADHELGGDRDPIACRRAGLALVPSDRQEEGMFPDLPVGSNVAMAVFGKRGGARLVTRRRERALARPWIDRMEVRPADPDVRIRSLSGGNQQKTIFARWLAADPAVFVLDQPTRGIDVGAKAQIYELVGELAEGGAAILVMSPELDELLHVCSDIGVVSRGRLVDVFPRETVSEGELVDLAIGGIGS